MTGNYVIIRLPRGGAAFLENFGGTLADNLEAGHKLCCELFPDPEQYDPKFLQTTRKKAEEYFERLKQEAESVHAPGGLGGRVVTQPGQLVRYTLSKDDTNMFGLVQAVSAAVDTPDSSSRKVEDNSDAKTPSRDALVTFYFRSPQALAEQTQSKSVDRQRLTVILSLQTLVHPKNIPPSGYRCWQRVFRPDGWIGLQPVEISSVSVEAANADQGDGAGALYKGHAVIHPLLGPDLDSPPNEGAPEESVGLDELFMDAVGESDKQPARDAEFTLSQKVAGEFADVRLLNQLSVTHLCRWLKFHISILEPDRRFTKNVLLQVRVQFWAVKILLATPLTTKLYMHFIKDIKDKSMRVGEDTAAAHPLGAFFSSDGDLMEHFNLKLNTEQLLSSVMAARRTEEYVKLALEGVAKLRAQIQQQGGVDFLTRLELDSRGPPQQQGGPPQQQGGQGGPPQQQGAPPQAPYRDALPGGPYPDKRLNNIHRGAPHLPASHQGTAEDL
ncbi:hypothetical protein, conserved [Eimeria necatrix]|uniref:Uncharacterized protein n=1 Tax=Eimeria necatrix TaxID=51315 RepID=U6MRF9_9EIME|nr:hypothetical protein, conserved [Eimeria necatrix]CDJ64250.1 hypothetical protein, conserved [Eimeria necatrix]